MAGNAVPSEQFSKNLLENPLAQPKPTSLWRDVFHRLLHNWEGMLGLGIIAFFALVALIAPWLAPYEVYDVDYKKDNLPPFWVERSVIGQQGDLAHPLGTDRWGRDLLSWGIFGTRTSMILGLVSAPLIAVIGALVGLFAGYAGGKVDNLIMRITDVFYSFPQIMITILVIIILKETILGRILSGMLLIFIAFLLVGWAGAARLVRGSVLAIKNTEFIEAAHCLGVPPLRVIFKHIMPNCLGPLLVWTTLMVPQLILTEAVLRYLQINPNSIYTRTAFFDSSWGGMIMEGRQFIHVHPIVVIIPAVCIGLISIAFTLVGDALRDVLDPQYQRSRTVG